MVTCSSFYMFLVLLVVLWLGALPSVDFEFFLLPYVFLSVLVVLLCNSVTPADF